MTFDLKRRAIAELVGTAFLLSSVIGSGVMGERLAAGNVAIALLANAVATGGALVALIFSLEKISGAHLNPAVSLFMAWSKQMAWREVPAYIGSQILGAIIGVVIAHLMFELPLIGYAGKARAGLGQFVSEFVATAGLLLVIGTCVKVRSAMIPLVVAGYIVSAYWFTASTSFANPAVTIARSLSDTFAGVRPADVPAFIAGQLLAVVIATVFLKWLMRETIDGDAEARSRQ